MKLKEVILQEKKLFLMYELLDKDLYKLIEAHRIANKPIPESKIQLYLY